MYKIEGMKTKAGREAERKYRESKPRMAWCCDILSPVGRKCRWCKEIVK